MSNRIVIDTADEAERSPRPGARSPILIGAVAAVALLAVTMFGTRDAEIPSAEITVPIEPFQAPEGTWVERSFDGDGGFTDVVAGSDGLVVVGSGRRVDSVPYAWYSPDGASWTAAVGEWSAGDVIMSVVATDAGFLAAGYRLGVEEGRALEDAVPRLWASTDGSDFELVEADGLPTRAVIDELTVFDGAFFALGWAGPAVLEPLRPPGPEASARVWKSPDGTTWTDSTPPGEESWFTGVFADQASVVLSGSSANRPALWTSTDGAAWELLPAPQADEQAEVAVAVTSSRDGFLALVRSREDVEGLISIWTVRTNGFWEPIEPQGRPNAAGWIERVGRGLLAGPGFTRSIYPGGPELWASEKGVEWVGVELTEGISPWPPTVATEVVDYQDRLLVFGSRGGVPTSWSLVEES